LIRTAAGGGSRKIDRRHLRRLKAPAKLGGWGGRFCHQLKTVRASGKPGNFHLEDGGELTAGDGPFEQERIEIGHVRVECAVRRTHPVPR